MKHFEPGQPILFRTTIARTWNYSLYNRITTCGTEHLIVGGCFVKDENILPYNDSTKYLLGTDDNYTEWKPKPNTIIAVRDDKEDAWRYRLFLYMDDQHRYVCKTDVRNGEWEWRYATSIEESLKD